MDPQNNVGDAAALGLIVLDVDVQGNIATEISIRISDTRTVAPAGFLEEIAMALLSAAKGIKGTTWREVEGYRGAMPRGGDALKILRMRGVRG